MDLFIVLGSALTFITWLYIVGRIQNTKELKDGRKEVHRGITNYARMQAQLATASEVIRKGWMGMTDYEKKQLEMGRIAISMCQLHLQDPKKFDPRTMADHLFNKFEFLELEEDIDQDEKSPKK